MRAFVTAAALAASLAAGHAYAKGEIVGRASVIDGDTIEVRGIRIRMTPLTDSLVGVLHMEQIFRALPVLQPICIFVQNQLLIDFYRQLNGAWARPGPL